MVWRTNTPTTNGLYLGQAITTQTSNPYSPDGWYWISSSAADASQAAGYPMRLVLDPTQPNGWRFQICGSIYTKKIHVENMSGCDFVFASNYKQMTWQEKELFYKANKHLPYLDNAAIMEKDGLDVSTNFSGLLQNVEENRIDITVLFKRLETIEKENEELKKELKRN